MQHISLYNIVTCHLYKLQSDHPQKCLVHLYISPLPTFLAVLFLEKLRWVYM